MSTDGDLKFVIQLIVTAVVTVVSTMRGYGAVKTLMLSELALINETIKSKVDLSIYSAKVKELHDGINALNIKVAVLEERKAGEDRSK